MFSCYSDGNYGLVKQVKSAQIKLNIQRLTLSLADVAPRVQLAGGAQQAESHILSMVSFIICSGLYYIVYESYFLVRELLFCHLLTCIMMQFF